MPPTPAGDLCPPTFRVINTRDTRDPRNPGEHYTWWIRHRDQTIFVNAYLNGADYIQAILEAVAALTVGPHRPLTLVPAQRNGALEHVS